MDVLTIIRRGLLALAAPVLVAALASGCSGSDGASKLLPRASTTSTAPIPGGKRDTKVPACAKEEASRTGFVRAFCGGSATVTYQIGDTKGTIEGGTCERADAAFSVNAGLVVDPTWKGARPDYVGIVLPEADGPFSGPKLTAAIIHDGSITSVTGISGTHDGKTVTLTGTAPEAGGAVKITVTC